MDDLQARLDAIGQRLAPLGRLFADAARAGEVPATGADEADAVEVEVDAGGRVVAIRPRNDWRDRVGRDGLGAAVVAAATAAASTRMQAWGRAVVDGRDRAAAATDPPTPPMPPPSGPPPTEGEVAELVRRRLAEARTADRPVATPDAETATGPTGRDARGEVTLTLGPGGQGLLACEVAPSLARTGTTASVADALAAALGAAHEAAAAEAGASGDPASDPLALLADLLAAIPSEGPRDAP